MMKKHYLLLIVLMLSTITLAGQVEESSVRSTFPIPKQVWVDEKWSSDVISLEPAFRLIDSSIKDIYANVTIEDVEFGNYTKNIFTNQTNITFDFELNKDMNKSELIAYFNKSYNDTVLYSDMMLWLKAPRPSLKDISYFSTNVPVSTWKDGFSLTSTPEYHLISGNITYNKLYNNWDTLRNATFHFELTLDWKQRKSFEIGIGTGSTVTNFTYETGQLQNNTVFDGFIYEKDFVDNTTASWYNGNDSTLEDSLMLLMHFNNDTLSDTEPDYFRDNQTQAYDYSNGQLNGTFSGNAGWDCVNKRLGDCAVFLDGNTDYVNLGDNLDNDGSDPMSIVAWIRSTSSVGQIIISKDVDGGNYEGWTFYIASVSDALHFDMRQDAGDVMLVESFTDVTDSTWYHVVMTYDGSKAGAGVKFYVDSVEEVSNVLVDTFTGSSTSPADTHIGNRGASALDFNGNIDELAVFNRTLSQEEIYNLYTRQNINRKEIELTDVLHRAEFPNISYLAVHKAGLDIIDADTGDLWMRFSEGVGNAFDVSKFNTVTALDSSIYVGSDNGLFDIDFEKDTITKYDNQRSYNYTTNISGRNNADGYGFGSQIASEYPEDTDGSDGMVLHIHLNNETLTDTLPDYFRDNQTQAYDYSTAQNNGTFLADTIWNCTGAKLGSCAIQFDGTDDSINLGTDSSLDLSVDSSWAFWFKATSLASNPRLISKMGAGGDRGYDFYIDASQEIVFESSDDGTTIHTFTTTALNLQTTTWYHVVFTKSGATGIFYINGNVEPATGTVDPTINAATVPTFISGFFEIPVTAPFNGLMDEIGIWNRTLSATEISDLYSKSFAIHNDKVNSIEVSNESLIEYLTIATDEGLTIWNKTDNSFSNSLFSEQINVVELNKTAIFYANNTDLGRILNIKGLSNGFTFTDFYTPTQRINDIEVNATDIFIATESQVETIGMNDMVLNLNLTTSIYGNETNATSIALNGTNLYVGTYGINGAVSKINLSSNLNIANWSADTTNESLNSNFTTSLSTYTNQSGSWWTLVGQLGGISVIKQFVESGVPPAVTPINHTGLLISSFNFEDSSTASATFVEIGTLEVNTTITNQDLIIIVTLQSALNNPPTTTAEWRILVDGNEIHDMERQVSVNSFGSVVIQGNATDVTVGQHNITLEHRRDGAGSRLLTSSNIGIAITVGLDGNLNPVPAGQIFDTIPDISFTSTIPTPILSREINIQGNSSRVGFIASIEMSATGGTDVSYFVGINDTNARNGTVLRRTLSSGSDTGVMGYDVEFTNITNGLKNITIYGFDSNGETITTHLHASAFQVQNETYIISQNETRISNVAVGTTPTNLLNSTIELKANADSIFVFTTGSGTVNNIGGDDVTFWLELFENNNLSGNITRTFSDTTSLGNMINQFEFNTGLANGNYTIGVWASSVSDTAQFENITMIAVGTTDLVTNLVSRPPTTPLVVDVDNSGSIAGTYNGKINITILRGVDPDEPLVLVNHNLTLVNTSGAFIYQINGSFNTSITLINISFDTTQVSDGIYKLNVSGTDNDGQTSSSLTADNITIDNPAPLVSLIYPENNTFFSISEINITYNVTNAATVNNCSLFLNGVLNRTDTSVTTDVDQFFNTTFEDGNYLWDVNCSRGSEVGESETRNFTIDTIDPIVTLISPPNNSLIQQFTDIFTFTYNVTDTNGINNCTLNIDGIQNTDAIVTKNISQTIDTTLSDGDYFWNVTCRDDANNLGLSSIFNVSLDKIFSSVDELIPLHSKRAMPYVRLNETNRFN